MRIRSSHCSRVSAGRLVGPWKMPTSRTCRSRWMTRISQIQLGRLIIKTTTCSSSRRQCKPPPKILIRAFIRWRARSRSPRIWCRIITPQKTKKLTMNPKTMAKSSSLKWPFQSSPPSPKTSNSNPKCTWPTTCTNWLRRRSSCRSRQLW